MDSKLSWEDQDQIVNELCTGIESLEESEFDRLYDQLDIYHKGEVDDAVRRFADNAVGDTHWDSDD